MKDNSRRNFVKTSAATGLTFTFAGLIRAHGAPGGGTTTVQTTAPQTTAPNTNNTTSSTGCGKKCDGYPTVDYTWYSHTDSTTGVTTYFQKCACKCTSSHAMGDFIFATESKRDLKNYIPANSIPTAWHVLNHVHA